MASVGPLEAWWSKKARMSCAAAPQGAAELGQLLESGGYAAAQRVDHRGHHGLAAAPVGVAVGGDDASGRRSRHTLTARCASSAKTAAQAGLLAAVSSGKRVRRVRRTP